MTATWRRAVLLLALGGAAAPAHAIPAFARRYRTTCATCHTAAPKLNVLGEAFRLNGYRMPVNERLLRREEPLPLGEDPWRDLWPRAIWPGEVPGAAPVSLRIQLDAYVARASGVLPTSSLRFPADVYFLAGGSLGENIGVFIEAEGNRQEPAELLQAKLRFQNVLPFAPRRLVNLWLGLQNPTLFTFADPQIDHAGRALYRWQEYRPSDAVLDSGGATLRSANEVRITAPQSSLQLTGLVGPRVFYAAGIAQGGPDDAADDNNSRKDFFYQLRWKIGGLRLDGTYADGQRTQGPVLGSHGHLFDRALILEHFGYSGAEPVSGGADGSYRAFGFAARLLAGPLDAGAGWVRRRDARPFGGDAPGALIQHSVFGRAEYFVFPWLMGSLRAERFDVVVAPETRAMGWTDPAFEETRFNPGVVVLVRQNVRAVAEADLYARHGASARAGQRRPAALWFRLDVAF